MRSRINIELKRFKNKLYHIIIIFLYETVKPTSKYSRSWSMNGINEHVRMNVSYFI